MQAALEATLGRAVEQIEQAGEDARAIMISDAAAATDALDVSWEEEAGAETAGAETEGGDS